ncbi:hypothetical protein KY332_01785 [Candidatus Woesearchaeota archaeon]|nr:hypothetical protein [Candidatus Woesearchaeota archaeon]
MAFKNKLNQLNAKINQLIAQIKAWPQYKKIGVGIIVLGFILLVIGILLY